MSKRSKTPRETVVLMREVRRQLKERGVATEVISVATTGSCYLRFEDPRIGKLRIGTHDERERYGYRWQLRTDIEEKFVDRTKGHPRFFYPKTAIPVLVEAIARYRAAIIRRTGE